ncbi:hypothetical protein O181_097342 [Austropuccinia psidii MF-1]|uniref:Uncharacterized protein n=1 Tax=Austropuccinia psidii MF-1 TaxID=1389203 RepID=A0A9Q3J933_9BASI|nr:hypothetical protein [Austropuccinia psidii MF-1]
MKALNYESYSDALRVLDLSNGKIKVSRDYIQPRSDTKVILCQKPETLPYSAELCQPRMVSLPLLKDLSEDSDNHVSGNDNTEDHDTPSNNQPVIVPQPLMSESHSKNYEYVPFYQKEPKDVSSQLSEENILESSKCHRRPPDRLMLADVVTYKTAISDPLQKHKWSLEVKQEYYSLMNYNTGDLVPYPSNGTKVLGGMWQLVQKRNEFGDVYKYKAHWVVVTGALLK